MGASAVETRRFGADRATFVVSCPTPAIRDTIEAAFIDLPDGVDTEPVVVQLEPGVGGTLSVLVDGELRFPAQNPNQALGAVVTSVTRIALDADPGQLHLHCAALALDDRGVLITARSGTGKTTLAAELLSRGWSYGSDESVSGCVDATSVTAFAKPLMIKNGAQSPIHTGLRDLRVVLDAEDDRIWTVPASAFHATCVTDIEPACLIVLTTEQHLLGYAPAQPAPIHPVDAVVALMNQTMDATRYGVRAVDVLASMASRSHCVQMQIGPLEAAATAVERLIDHPPAQHRLQFLHSSASVAPWHVADYVRSALIDERVVIHDTRGGAITALDEAGTAIWRVLLGDPPAGMGLDVLQTPTVERFVNQLAMLGFVHAGERQQDLT